MIANLVLVIAVYEIINVNVLRHFFHFRVASTNFT